MDNNNRLTVEQFRRMFTDLSSWRSRNASYLVESGPPQRERPSCPDCQDTGEVPAVDQPGQMQPCPCVDDEPRTPQQYP